MRREYTRGDFVLHSTCFSATGGMGRDATCFYKRLASMLAQKWDHSYSTTLLAEVSSDLPYSLSHPIPTLRGARSSQHHTVYSPAAIDLAITESHIYDTRLLIPLFTSSFLLCKHNMNSRSSFVVHLIHIIYRKKKEKKTKIHVNTDTAEELNISLEWPYHCKAL